MTHPRVGVSSPPDAVADARPPLGAGERVYVAADEADSAVIASGTSMPAADCPLISADSQPTVSQTSPTTAELPLHASGTSKPAADCPVTGVDSHVTESDTSKPAADSPVTTSVASTTAADSGGTPSPSTTGRGGAGPVRVLGVRHHGPGSARAVVRALEAHDPDIVLIEGPPEADALVTWVGRGLVPPVALLAYDQANPRRAAYWPYAEFSPEWQALRWAHEHRREVRFCDLPAAVVLADAGDDADVDPVNPLLPAEAATAPDTSSGGGGEGEVGAPEAAGATSPDSHTTPALVATSPDTTPAQRTTSPNTTPARRTTSPDTATPATTESPDTTPTPGTTSPHATTQPSGTTPTPETTSPHATTQPSGTTPTQGTTSPNTPPPATTEPSDIAPPDSPKSPDTTPSDATPADDSALPDNPPPTDDPTSSGSIRDDPLAVLALAAGYSDPERWWDDVMEQRTAGDPFDVIGEAMAELRAAGVGRPTGADQLREARREAAMRQALRRAIKDADRVAVVCGAWHVPALTGKLPSASRDATLLRKLPKVKVTTAWVPWTHSRLSYASGYGAGIDSPGWYDHLFTSPDAVVERWMTAVAGVLRDHDRPVSSAHSIEATRLAETLATLRGRPTPGLDEVQEAALAVMCEGSTAWLRWVTTDLVVGEKLGEVPRDAPMVPLEADLRRLARSARLAISADPRQLVLDLRKDTDRAKSVLLHRLAILAIDWGRLVDVAGTGTFKEGWSLAWRPELAVDIVLASRYGTTVQAAAEAAILTDPGDLPDVTRRLERALTADLASALPALLTVLDQRAAHDADVLHLLAALPALVRAQRYGTVRGTDTSALARVSEALLARACAGLPAAASGAGPEASATLRSHLDAVHLVTSLLTDEARDLWWGALARLSVQGDCPGLLAGRATRILLDADVLDAHEAGTRLSRALSHGPSLADRAGYAEGFLAGSALLIVHDEHLVPIIKAWVSRLSDDDFLEVLPVVRRAFGSYSPAERRQISQRVSRGESLVTARQDDPDWDLVAPVVSTVGLLLGRRP